MNRIITFPVAYTISALLSAQPGTLDPTFSGDGIQILQPSTSHDVGKSVIALPDTSLLICGVAFVGGAPQAFFTHLHQNGAVDTNYGTNGYTYFNSGQETYAYHMVRAMDGSIFACGTAYPTYPQQKIAVFHLFADGTPDPAFGTGGMVITTLGADDAEADGMAIQPDGKLVLGGRVGFGTTSNALILRYNPNGTLDNTFSGDGMLVSTVYSTEDQLWDVDVLADGSIVGAGNADIIGDVKTMLVKCDASGILMTSFGGDGVLIPGFNVTSDHAWAVQADGTQFFVAGYLADVLTDQDTYLAKFNSDGTPAAGFGTSGLTYSNTNPYELAFDIVKQADDKVLVCGTSGQFGLGAARDFLTIRYLANGAPDATFGANGIVITSIQTDFDDANAIAIQPDGKVVAVGFTSGFSLGTNNDVAVVRYEGGPSTVGISDALVHVNNATCYPNPTNSAIRIHHDVVFNNITITNSVGAVVLDRTIAIGVHELELTMGATGMYCFSLKDHGVQVATGRFSVE